LLHNISTGSGSDRVTMQVMSTLCDRHDPVAPTTPRGLPARGPRSAPGTDLVLMSLPSDESLGYFHRPLCGLIVPVTPTLHLRLSLCDYGFNEDNHYHSQIFEE